MAFDSISLKPEKGPEWTKDDTGTPVPPVFLLHVGGDAMEVKMTLSLLHAYGIPTVCQYPNDGSFANVIMGFAPAGTDIFVPETALEDARNILSSEIKTEEE